ncbi:RodZ domain-containing protein [uncultured Metabacillus sp.]|uniref:helix-turn-helix domain-containing protein n=1 Tax=uncultured Metabacillus sp. TaxID=2860135 RepID=UPI0026200C56|nr:RodZ domain-containing protein [uncultured Metabacillus sp.]
MLRLSELGNRLKQAREEKNISLDDLQAMTKIQKRYLLGIEEGNYSMIPGKFYVRAFIKQYAEAVNLNPEMIFEEYKNEIPSTYNDDLPEQLSRVKTHKQLPKSASKFLDLLPRLLIVAAVILIAIVFWVWRQNAADSNPGEEATKVENGNEYTNNVENTAAGNEDEDPEEEVQEETPPVEEEVKQEPETPAQTLTVKGKEGTTTTYNLSGAAKFQLEVIAKGRTWVSIKNGKGKSFFGAEIAGGESQTFDFTAESEITVRVGNVPGTELKINGQLLQYEDAKTTPQNITIIYSKE